MAGRQTLGSFELLSPIATGGMAELFLARQSKRFSSAERGGDDSGGLSRLVVIKRIMRHLAQNPEFLSMFMREARLAARINHPNVVQIYDVGESQGEYYIAMEYIDGLSVGQLLTCAVSRQRRVPVAVAVEIALQVCAGLHAAHELRDEHGAKLDLVHRDVSPHNLMLTRAGHVKLVDFGIAKAKDSKSTTRTGHARGKVSYMSPEQARGEPLDRRTDIFSVGIVLHELTTARRLFKRTTELMSLKAVCDDPIPAPTEGNQELPAPLGEVILKALCREPEGRFATAAELGQALRDALEASGAPPTSPRTVSAYLERELSSLMDDQERQVRQAVTGSFRSKRITAPHDAPTRTVTSAGELEAPPGEGRAPRRRGLWIGVVSAALLLVAGAAAGLLYQRSRGPSHPAGAPLRYGLVPIYPSKVVKQDLRPFARYLERRLKRPVEIHVSEDYAALGRALRGGVVQFAALPPLEYVLTRAREPQIRAIASQTYEGARSYQGLLVVKADSSIRKMHELAEKRICYVDPDSTSGYLMARGFLRRQGFDPDRDLAGSRFSGKHIAVMRDVLAGRCDVGAIFSTALLNARDFGLASTALRTLAVTGQAPYGVVCSGPEVDAALVATMRRALLELRPPKHLKQPVVGTVYRISGYLEPRVADFAPIEDAARAEGLLKTSP